MPTHYERRLPHILPPGETLFVTFRLAGSLPKGVVERLQAEQLLTGQVGQLTPTKRYAEQKRYFARFDALLDGATAGPLWLRGPQIAAVLTEALHHRHGRAYDLTGYCLMLNHVHLVVQLPPNAPSFVRTLQSLKSFTAGQINRVLGRTGQVWQRESYDHVVRSSPELDRIRGYVLENPVRANLVEDWTQWPYLYWQ